MINGIEDDSMTDIAIKDDIHEISDDFCDSLDGFGHESVNAIEEVEEEDFQISIAPPNFQRQKEFRCFNALGTDLHSCLEKDLVNLPILPWRFSAKNAINVDTPTTTV